MDDIMEIKHFARKRAHTDTTQKFFYIWRKKEKGNQLNDKNTFFLIIKSLKPFSIWTVIWLANQANLPPSAVTESHHSRQQYTVVHIHRTTYAVNVG
jgi:hypothetical protein